MPINEEKIIEKKDEVSDNKKLEMSLGMKKPHKKINKPFIIAISAAGLLLIVAGVAIVDNFVIRNNRQEMGQQVVYSQSMGGGRSMSGMSYGSTSGVVVKATQTDITSGVVISVGDDSFVIAGGGEQYTVNTSDDTTYNNDDETVEVNDSVTVIGDESDGVITADQVQILN